jgi:hypothetical protein
MLWLGCQSGPYGQIRVAGQLYWAHRMAYELAYGPIPEGLQVDHVKAKGCISTLCVAPDHLEAVTQAENMRRGNCPSAVNARKTCCPQGHPYDCTSPQGKRSCRRCKRRQNRARRKAAL